MPFSSHQATAAHDQQVLSFPWSTLTTSHVGFAWLMCLPPSMLVGRAKLCVRVPTSGVGMYACSRNTDNLSRYLTLLHFWFF